VVLEVEAGVGIEAGCDVEVSGCEAESDGKGSEVPELDTVLMSEAMDSVTVRKSAWKGKRSREWFKAISPGNNVDNLNYYAG
jgi:hypothetical protein